MVLHKHGEMLYDNVKKTTAEMLQPIAQKLINMPDEDLLQEITSVWHLEKNVIHKISDILLYMNKNFVPKMRNYPTVEAMQTNEFKKNVVMKDDIKRKLVKLLLLEIQKERDGDMVERLYLQKSIEMLIEVGMQSKKIYEQEFETALISQTRDYYRNESNNFITQNSCNAYLAKANARLNEEQDRVNSYLHHSSQDKILNEFLKEYIENHAKTLLKM
jgi:cullin 3